MEIRKVILIIISIVAFVACEHSPLPPIETPDPITDTTDTENDSNWVECSQDTVYFVQVILPMLNSNCATSGCHDVETAEDDVVLSDYQSIMSTGEVVPFQAFESEIIEVLFERDPEDVMPPPDSSPLTTQQKNDLIKWINQGAKNNSCVPSVCDTIDVSFSNDVFPIISNSCTGCHSGSTPDGDIGLNNYQEVKDAVVNSNLLNSILWNGLATNMPENGDKLSDCQIKIIETWINDGTPNN